MPSRAYGGHSDKKGAYFTNHPAIVLRRKKERLDKALAVLRKKHPENIYEIKTQLYKGNESQCIKIVGKKGGDIR